MGAKGNTSPIRTAGYENLQLNAGMFLIGFDYTTYKTAAALKTALATEVTNGTKLLGMTRGGGTFVVQSELREPEVDGKRYGFVGGTFVDSVDARLTGTLIEITPANMAKIMATGDVEVSSESGAYKTTVTMHTQVQPEDYIQNLVWVGDISDGRLVMIALDNALNTNGLTLTFQDKNEGTMPFEFRAYQSNVADYDVAPFKVIYLADAA